MQFKEQKELEMFLRDERFCSSKESYCLGNTLEEAGQTIREIRELIEKGEQEEDVGMDNE